MTDRNKNLTETKAKEMKMKIAEKKIQEARRVLEWVRDELAKPRSEQAPMICEAIDIALLNLR